MDLKPIFDQYLRTTNIPRLECKVKRKKLTYKWINCNVNFNMPIRVKINNGEYLWVKPTTEPQLLKQSKKIRSVDLDPNFYVRKS